MEEKREIVDNFSDLFDFQEDEQSEKGIKCGVVDRLFGGTSLLYAMIFQLFPPAWNNFKAEFLGVGSDWFRPIPTKIPPFSSVKIHIISVTEGDIVGIWLSIGSMRF